MAAAQGSLDWVRQLPLTVRMCAYSGAFLSCLLLLLPWLFDEVASRWCPWRLGTPWLRVCGWLLLGGSSLGYAVGTWQLVRRGAGAYVEFDPPVLLVDSGLYARCRNPLVVCVLGMLLGLGAGTGSPGVFALFLLAVPLAVAQVRLIEEPLLARRFGTAYEHYAARVPRWNPFGTREDARCASR